MSWVSNNLEASIGIVTLAATVIGYLASLWLKRKQVTYRVHLDTRVGVTPNHGNDIELEWRYKGETVQDPSFALVRIMNTGSREIRKVDFESPLNLTFAGRTVVDAKVVEASDDLLTIVRQDEQWPPVGDPHLELPLVPLNRGNRIKVLVLLSGHPEPGVRSTSCGGFISGGRILRDTTKGDGMSNRNKVFGGIALLLVGASLTLLAVAPGLGGGSTCAAGEAKLAGSSAFTPIAEAIGKKYMDKCGDAKVVVRSSSSEDGLVELDSLAKDNPAEQQIRIAMSDGPAPSTYPNLAEYPIGVLTFAVVVNRDAQINELKTDDVKAIFAGQITNWRQLGGADLPVRIVTREPGSGTRMAFDDKVLKGKEPDPTAKNCRDVVATITLCQRGSTSEVLDAVNSIPGAVGYAEVSAAAEYQNLKSVRLNGFEPNFAAIDNGYPFWAVEFFYTYGSPDTGKIVDSVLKYMTSDTAKNILHNAGYRPCVDAADLCKR